MSKEIPNADYVYNALLRYNYLPIGERHPDNIPFKVFSSENFTRVKADEMLTMGMELRKNVGYDQIEYRATRYDLRTRVFNIPHPMPYARLCKYLSENWDALSHICDNANSRDKIAKYDNGRLIYGVYELLEQITVMNYNKHSDMRYKLAISIGKFWRVKADISSFYSSVYTHSIQEALVGQDEARANSENRELWYNKLSNAQRELNRGEVYGVPTGPGTSRIVTEIILYAVDQALSSKGYHFIRYIDDYECYCDTHKQTEDFLLDLQQELRKYRLKLNTTKVFTEELPIAFQPQWLLNLKSHLSANSKLSISNIADFLDSAVELQKTFPNGSVLKYAARTLANSGTIEKDSADFLIKYLIAIAVYRPNILPVLCQVAKQHHSQTSLDITSILQQSIKFQRSDAICWGLYLMGICGQEVSEDLAEKIVETGDCMSMGMLIALNQHKEKVVDFLKTIDNRPASEYECDKYWILLHELTLDCPEFKSYCENSGLKFLSENNIHFIKPIDTEVESLTEDQEKIQPLLENLGLTEQVSDIPSMNNFNNDIPF